MHRPLGVWMIWRQVVGRQDVWAKDINTGIICKDKIALLCIQKTFYPTPVAGQLLMSRECCDQ